MNTTEIVNLIIEGNSWDLDAVPLEDWLPIAAMRLKDNQPYFDILNDPNWYKDLDDDTRHWFAGFDNVMEFLMDHYETDTVIKSTKCLMHEYNLCFTPVCMTSFNRFATQCGTRLIEMSTEGQDENVSHS